jgi:hypothetical protein
MTLSHRAGLLLGALMAFACAGACVAALYVKW